MMHRGLFWLLSQRRIKILAYFARTRMITGVTALIVLLAIIADAWGSESLGYPP